MYLVFDIHMFLYNSMQYVSPGESADLEVLQYADIDNFSFHWTKVGSRCQIKTTHEPNILSFPCVRERDFGHYKCEVREAGKLILTLYRALLKEQGWFWLILA